jgi:DNA-binding response OmpR family regulator
MELGGADNLPQDVTHQRIIGVLCSDERIADDLCTFIEPELGTRPVIIREDEIHRVEVLIVAENTINGVILCVERVRHQGFTIPLMVVTRDDQPAAFERAFSAGADDFVTVPNRKSELPLRLIAIRRRASGIWTRESMPVHLDSVRGSSSVASESNVESAPISTRGAVVVKGLRVVLTTRELAMFKYLRAKPKVWVNAAELLSAVSDCPSQRDSTLVRVHMSAIRKKLGKYAHLIESRRTYGYRWVGIPGEI